MQYIQLTMMAYFCYDYVATFLDIIIKDNILTWRAYYKSGEIEPWYFSESQKRKKWE